MNTNNMAYHLPQIEDHSSGVTTGPIMTVEEALAASEVDGAVAVHVAAAPDGVAVVSEFEDYTRIIEITPEGAFVRTI